jgi:hypothetical protein
MKMQHYNTPLFESIFLHLPHCDTPSFESVVNKRLKPHPPTDMSHCYMFLGILRTTMRNDAMNRQSDFLSTEHFLT